MKNLRIRKLMAMLSLLAASGLWANSALAQATTTTSSTTTTTTTAAPTSAQVATPAATEEPMVLEKFVVTGSNIPMAAEAAALPVVSVDAQVMSESGVNSDLLDILRKVSPNISGVGSEAAQIQTGNNFGGASVNIKGLPTLVLINGRRVANDPSEAGEGGPEFVDLNLIPPAMIDRVEVLQDGASAIYGSDAVGGVINIILKKDFNGWEMGVHYGYNTDTGHYTERSGYLVGGVSNDKTSITVGVDYSQHTDLFLASRPYTNPIYGTYTFPGSLEVYNNITGNDQFYQLGAGVNAPPGGANLTIQQLVANGTYVPEATADQFHAFNLANGETLIGALKRYSTTINMEHKIFGDNLVGFADIIASHTYTSSQLNAQPNVPYLEDPWIDVNVLGFPSSPPPAGTAFIPVTAPTNPFSQNFLDQGQVTPESGPGFGNGSGYEILARSRFLNYPRIYQQDAELYRIVGGLRGDITPDIHWEAAANIDRYTLAFTNPGLLDTNALLAAMADGQINPFAINQAPGAFNGVIGTAFVNMVSALNSYDFKVDGTPFDLPAGKLGFAAGISYVRETLSAVPDINSLPNSSGTTQGWDNATTWQYFSANRNFISYFGEVSVPVTGAKQEIPGAHSINIDGAVRYDDYSGAVGSSTDPQVSLSWAPIDDQFKFRASAGKSFIAPELYDLYGPVSSGSTTSITYNSVGGSSNTAQFNQTGGANPDLKPTTAKSWTVGFIYTPKFVDGLSITVDYSDIAMKSIVGNVPASTIIQSVETNGTSSPYAADVHFNSPTGPSITGSGQISSHSPQQIYVIENLLNLAGEKINSTDIKVEYVKKVAGIGRFDLTSTWTWYNSYELELIPTEQYYQYTATASVNLGTVPRWRTYTTLDWTNHGLDAFVGVTWVDSVTDIGTGGDNQFGLEGVGTFTAFDLGLTYDFSKLHVSKWLDGLKVTLGVNNVANRLPPLAPNAFPDTNADVGTYDGAVGRMWYVNAKYSF
jgi:iron complex outermembrane receptor protein